MKVYIAAPFFNEKQLEIVEELEAVLHDHGIDYYSPRSEGTLSAMTVEEQKRVRKHVFDTNIKNMDECTHMVACTQYKDTGTIFEMGYYHGVKKPIIMMTFDLTNINVMLAESCEAVTTGPYHATRVLLGKDISVDVESYT